MPHDLSEPKEFRSDTYIVTRSSYSGPSWSLDNVPYLPIFHHKSMLRIPFIDNDEYTFLFIFWSDDKNIFNDENLIFFYELILPLVNDIQEDLPDIGKYTGESIYNNVELEQCISYTPGIIPIIENIESIATCDLPVLILGETGVGKECIVDILQKKSLRAEKPFIKINCGAISDDLIDSELFGHEKGSFTGAGMTRAGFFEQAAGGTLFLDEIGEMSVATQIRLLRILDTGIVRRVGSSREFRVDVRIIAATHEDILEKVAKGFFRKDLWFRLSVLSIHIPPLRKRPEDISILIQFFINKYYKKCGLNSQPSISAVELKKFLDYSWPGNVRELEHAVQRALVESAMQKSQTLSFSIVKLPNISTSISKNEEELLPNKMKWISLREHEYRYIKEVIKYCEGKLTGPNSATRILNMHYATLRNRMKELE